MSLEQEVIDIVAKLLSVNKNEITLSTSLIDDLSVDSLDITELVVFLEEKYDCRISKEDIPKLKTIGDIVSYIKSVKK